jgi:hypothetical protein
MNKTIVWVIGFGAAGFAFYKFYWDSQKRYAQLIINNGYYSDSISNLLSFEKGYVKAWAKSAQSRSAQFEYMGVLYKTAGGLKVAVVVPTVATAIAQPTAPVSASVTVPSAINNLPLTYTM